MSGIFKRIAAIGRAILGTGTGSNQGSSNLKSAAATGPVLSETSARPLPLSAAPPCAVPLKVTVSKPEPLSFVDPDHVPYVRHDAAGTLVGETSKADPRPAAMLRSTRHPVSPIAAKKVHGRSTAAKSRRAKSAPPRRAKAEPAMPVRVNRISGDQVRMQAALMRCQRVRDAQRALDKLKALRPTATVHTLQRAA